MRNNQEMNAVAALLDTEPDIRLAWVFGSVSAGKAQPVSDIDIAVLGKEQIDSTAKAALIQKVGLLTGRPVDLIDMRIANPVMQREVFNSGKLLVNKDRKLLSQIKNNYVYLMQDWQPYRDRILKERQEKWINS